MLDYFGTGGRLPKYAGSSFSQALRLQYAMITKAVNSYDFLYPLVSLHVR